jgi:8-oxo-dGTP pyrophosphatase MutT (NUDIX family)
MTTTPPTTPPATPRLSATMVLVRDDPFQVLLVRRHAKAVFASALVFPGGVVDDDDYSDEWMPLLASGGDLPPEERAIRIAGVRETFEETALLLATLPDGSPVTQPERTDARFIDVVRASGGLIRLDDLHPFGHWITPEPAPRRFDTHFLLARAPKEQTPVADGGETVDLEWARPAEVVRRAEDDQHSIIFPTLLNLMRLAESDDSASAIAAAQNRTPYTVLPVVEQRDGGRMAVIPAEAGYGVTEHPAP